MYWAGIAKVHYIIPKSQTDTKYAYEDSLPMQDRIKQFNTPINAEQDEPCLTRR